MCIPQYKDMSTRHPTNGTPALMAFENIRDLIDACNNQLELDDVQRIMEQAEFDYGDDVWCVYGSKLATLHHGRRRNIAKELLNRK